MNRSTVSLLIGALALSCESDAPPAPQPVTTTTASSVETQAPSASAAAPAPRPLYYDKAISDADLKGRTLRELALLRNTIYARAGNTFRRPWLDAHFRAQPWYQPKPALDESKITKLDRENARKIAEYDSAIDKKELERRRDEVLARRKAGSATPEDEVELSLLSQRLGTWLGGKKESPTPLEDHTQLDRLLRVEELSTLSRRDLRILRNTVYARHGRIFDSAVVRSYFEGAKWYKPNPEFDEGKLTAVDNKNIAIIRSVEDSLGGPLHENPDYGTDGWFVMA
jgi:hypothetical protein